MADPNNLSDKDKKYTKMSELFDDLEQEEIIYQPAAYNPITDDDVKYVYTIVGLGAPLEDVNSSLQEKFLPPLEEWPEDLQSKKQDILKQISIQQEQIKAIEKEEDFKESVAIRKPVSDEIDALIDDRFADKEDVLDKKYTKMSELFDDLEYDKTETVATKKPTPEDLVPSFSEEWVAFDKFNEETKDAYVEANVRLGNDNPTVIFTPEQILTEARRQFATRGFSPGVLSLEDAEKYIELRNKSFGVQDFDEAKIEVSNDSYTKFDEAVFSVFNTELTDLFEVNLRIAQQEALGEKAPSPTAIVDQRTLLNSLYSEIQSLAQIEAKNKMQKFVKKGETFTPDQHRSTMNEVRNYFEASYLLRLDELLSEPSFYKMSDFNLDDLKNIPSMVKTTNLGSVGKSLVEDPEKQGRLNTIFNGYDAWARENDLTEIGGDTYFSVFNPRSVVYATGIVDTGPRAIIEYYNHKDAVLNLAKQKANEAGYDESFDPVAYYAVLPTYTKQARYDFIAKAQEGSVFHQRIMENLGESFAYPEYFDRSKYKVEVASVLGRINPAKQNAALEHFKENEQVLLNLNDDYITKLNLFKTALPQVTKARAFEYPDGFQDDTALPGTIENFNTIIRTIFESNDPDDVLAAEAFLKLGITNYTSLVDASNALVNDYIDRSIQFSVLEITNRNPDVWMKYEQDLTFPTGLESRLIPVRASSGTGLGIGGITASPILTLLYMGKAPVQHIKSPLEFILNSNDDALRQHGTYADGEKGHYQKFIEDLDAEIDISSEKITNKYNEYMSQTINGMSMSEAKNLDNLDDDGLTLKPTLDYISSAAEYKRAETKFAELHEDKQKLVDANKSTEEIDKEIDRARKLLKIARLHEEKFSKDVQSFFNAAGSVLDYGTNSVRHSLQSKIANGRYKDARDFLQEGIEYATEQAKTELGPDASNDQIKIRMEEILAENIGSINTMFDGKISPGYIENRDIGSVVEIHQSLNDKFLEPYFAEGFESDEILDMLDTAIVAQDKYKKINERDLIRGSVPFSYNVDVSRTPENFVESQYIAELNYEQIPVEFRKHFKLDQLPKTIDPRQATIQDFVDNDAINFSELKYAASMTYMASKKYNFLTNIEDFMLGLGNNHTYNYHTGELIGHSSPAMYLFDTLAAGGEEAIAEQSIIPAFSIGVSQATMTGGGHESVPEYWTKRKKFWQSKTDLQYKDALRTTESQPYAQIFSDRLFMSDFVDYIKTRSVEEGNDEKISHKDVMIYFKDFFQQFYELSEEEMQAQVDSGFFNAYGPRSEYDIAEYTKEDANYIFGPALATALTNRFAYIPYAIGTSYQRDKFYYQQAPDIYDPLNTEDNEIGYYARVYDNMTHLAGGEYEAYKGQAVRLGGFTDGSVYQSFADTGMVMAFALDPEKWILGTLSGGWAVGAGTFGFGVTSARLASKGVRGVNTGMTLSQQIVYPFRQAGIEVSTKLPVNYLPITRPVKVGIDYTIDFADRTFYNNISPKPNFVTETVKEITLSDAGRGIGYVTASTLFNATFGSLIGGDIGALYYTLSPLENAAMNRGFLSMAGLLPVVSGPMQAAMKGYHNIYTGPEQWASDISHELRQRLEENGESPTLQMLLDTGHAQNNVTRFLKSKELDDKDTFEFLINAIGLTMEEAIAIEKTRVLSYKKTIAELAQGILLDDAEVDQLRKRDYKEYGGVELADGTFIGIGHLLKKQDSYKRFQRELYALVAQGKITKDTADLNFSSLRATAIITGNLDFFEGRTPGQSSKLSAIDPQTLEAAFGKGLKGDEAIAKLQEMSGYADEAYFKSIGLFAYLRDKEIVSAADINNYVEQYRLKKDVVTEIDEASEIAETDFFNAPNLEELKDSKVAEVKVKDSVVRVYFDQADNKIVIREVHIDKPVELVEDASIRAEAVKSLFAEKMKEGVYKIDWSTKDAFKQLKIETGKYDLGVTFENQILDYIEGFGKIILAKEEGHDDLRRTKLKKNKDGRYSQQISQKIIPSYFKHNNIAAKRTKDVVELKPIRNETALPLFEDFNADSIDRATMHKALIENTRKIKDQQEMFEIVDGTDTDQFKKDQANIKSFKDYKAFVNNQKYKLVFDKFYRPKQKENLDKLETLINEAETPEKKAEILANAVESMVPADLFLQKKSSLQRNINKFKNEIQRFLDILKEVDTEAIEEIETLVSRTEADFTATKEAQLAELDALLEGKPDKFLQEKRDQIAEGKFLTVGQAKSIRQNLYKKGKREEAELFRVAAIPKTVSMQMNELGFNFELGDAEQSVDAQPVAITRGLGISERFVKKGDATLMFREMSIGKFSENNAYLLEGIDTAGKNFSVNLAETYVQLDIAQNAKDFKLQAELENKLSYLKEEIAKNPPNDFEDSMGFARQALRKFLKDTENLPNYIGYQADNLAYGGAIRLELNKAGLDFTEKTTEVDGVPYKLISLDQVKRTKGADIFPVYSLENAQTSLTNRAKKLFEENFSADEFVQIGGASKRWLGLPEDASKELFEDAVDGISGINIFKSFENLYAGYSKAELLNMIQNKEITGALADNLAKYLVQQGPNKNYTFINYFGIETNFYARPDGEKLLIKSVENEELNEAMVRNIIYQACQDNYENIEFIDPNEATNNVLANIAESWNATPEKNGLKFNTEMKNSVAKTPSPFFAKERVKAGDQSLTVPEGETIDASLQAQYEEYLNKDIRSWNTPSTEHYDMFNNVSDAAINGTAVFTQKILKDLTDNISRLKNGEIKYGDVLIADLTTQIRIGLEGKEIKFADLEKFLKDKNENRLLNSLFRQTLTPTEGVNFDLIDAKGNIRLDEVVSAWFASERGKAFLAGFEKVASEVELKRKEKRIKQDENLEQMKKLEQVPPSQITDLYVLKEFYELLLPDDVVEQSRIQRFPEDLVLLLFNNVKQTQRLNAFGYTNRLYDTGYRRLEKIAKEKVDEPAKETDEAKIPAIADEQFDSFLAQLLGFGAMPDDIADKLLKVLKIKELEKGENVKKGLKLASSKMFEKSDAFKNTIEETVKQFEEDKITFTKREVVDYEKKYKKLKQEKLTGRVIKKEEEIPLTAEDLSLAAQIWATGILKRFEKRKPKGFSHSEVNFLLRKMVNGSQGLKAVSARILDIIETNKKSFEPHVGLFQQVLKQIPNKVAESLQKKLVEEFGEVEPKNQFFADVSMIAFSHEFAVQKIQQDMAEYTQDQLTMLNDTTSMQRVELIDANTLPIGESYFDTIELMIDSLLPNLTELDQQEFISFYDHDVRRDGTRVLTKKGKKQLSDAYKTHHTAPHNQPSSALKKLKTAFTQSYQFVTVQWNQIRNIESGPVVEKSPLFDMLNRGLKPMEYVFKQAKSRSQTVLDMHLAEQAKKLERPIITDLVENLQQVATRDKISFDKKFQNAREVMRQDSEFAGVNQGSKMDAAIQKFASNMKDLGINRTLFDLRPSRYPHINKTRKIKLKNGEERYTYLHQEITRAERNRAAKDLTIEQITPTEELIDARIAEGKVLVTPDDIDEAYFQLIKEGKPVDLSRMLDSAHSLVAFKRERAKNRQGFVNVTTRTMVRYEQAEEYNDLARLKVQEIFELTSEQMVSKFNNREDFGTITPVREQLDPLYAGITEYRRRHMTNPYAEFGPRVKAKLQILANRIRSTPGVSQLNGDLLKRINESGSTVKIYVSELNIIRDQIIDLSAPQLSQVGRSMLNKNMGPLFNSLSYLQDLFTRGGWYTGAKFTNWLNDFRGRIMEDFDPTLPGKGFLSVEQELSPRILAIFQELRTKLRALSDDVMSQINLTQESYTKAQLAAAETLFTNLSNKQKQALRKVGVPTMEIGRMLIATMDEPVHLSFIPMLQNLRNGILNRKSSQAIVDVNLILGTKTGTEHLSHLLAAAKQQNIDVSDLEETFRRYLDREKSGKEYVYSKNEIQNLTKKYDTLKARISQSFFNGKVLSAEEWKNGLLDKAQQIMNKGMTELEESAFIQLQTFHNDPKFADLFKNDETNLQYQETLAIIMSGLESRFEQVVSRGRLFYKSMSGKKLNEMDVSENDAIIAYNLFYSGKIAPGDADLLRMGQKTKYDVRYPPDGKEWKKEDLSTILKFNGYRLGENQIDETILQNYVKGELVEKFQNKKLEPDEIVEIANNISRNPGSRSSSLFNFVDRKNNMRLPAKDANDVGGALIEMIVRLRAEELRSEAMRNLTELHLYGDIKQVVREELVKLSMDPIKNETYFLSRIEFYISEFARSGFIKEVHYELDGFGQKRRLSYYPDKKGIEAKAMAIAEEICIAYEIKPQRNKNVKIETYTTTDGSAYLITEELKNLITDQLDEVSPVGHAIDQNRGSLDAIFENRFNEDRLRYALSFANHIESALIVKLKAKNLGLADKQIENIVAQFMMESNPDFPMLQRVIEEDARTLSKTAREEITALEIPKFLKEQAAMEIQEKYTESKEKKKLVEVIKQAQSMPAKKSFSALSAAIREWAKQHGINTSEVIAKIEEEASAPKADSTPLSSNLLEEVSSLFKDPALIKGDNIIDRFQLRTFLEQHAEMAEAKYTSEGLKGLSKEDQKRTYVDENFERKTGWGAKGWEAVLEFWHQYPVQVGGALTFGIGGAALGASIAVPGLGVIPLAAGALVGGMTGAFAGEVAKETAVGVQIAKQKEQAAPAFSGAARGYESYLRIKKQAVTTGLLLPTFAYFVNNAIGAIFQAYTEGGVLGLSKMFGAAASNPLIYKHTMELLTSNADGLITKNPKTGIAGKRSHSIFVTRDGRIYTAETLKDACNRNGIGGSFIKQELGTSILEDIRKNNRSGMQKLLSWFTDSPWVEFANVTENFFRVAHFMDGLNEGLSEAVAAKRVRDTFYDYAALSPREKKVLRQVFLFYSYMRKNQIQVFRTLFRENPSNIINQLRLIRNSQKEYLESGEDRRKTIPDYYYGRLFGPNPLAVLFHYHFDSDQDDVSNWNSKYENMTYGNKYSRPVGIYPMMGAYEGIQLIAGIIPKVVWDTVSDSISKEEGQFDYSYIASATSPAIKAFVEWSTGKQVFNKKDLNKISLKESQIDAINSYFKLFQKGVAAREDDEGYIKMEEQDYPFEDNARLHETRYIPASGGDVLLLYMFLETIGTLPGVNMVTGRPQKQSKILIDLYKGAFSGEEIQYPPGYDPLDPIAPLVGVNVTQMQREQYTDQRKINDAIKMIKKLIEDANK